LQITKKIEPFCSSIAISTISYVIRCVINISRKRLSGTLYGFQSYFQSRKAVSLLQRKSLEVAHVATLQPLAISRRCAHVNYFTELVNILPVFERTEIDCTIL